MTTSFSKRSFWTFLPAFFFLVTFASPIFTLYCTLNKIESDFIKQVQTNNNLLKENLESLDKALNKVAEQYTNSAKLSLHPLVSNTFIAARITAEKRERFEMRKQAEEYPDFTITQFANNNSFTPAGVRRLYLPINQIEPDSPISRTLFGADLFSNPTIMYEIQVAIDSGLITYTSAGIFSEQDREYYLLKVIYKDNVIPTSISERRQNYIAIAGFRILTKNLLALDNAEYNLKLNGLYFQDEHVIHTPKSKNDTEFVFKPTILSQSPIKAHNDNFKVKSIKNITWQNVSNQNLTTALIISFFSFILFLFSIKIRHS